VVELDATVVVVVVVELEPADVVTVVELAEVEVVGLVVPELQPAAKIAAVVASTKPAAMRLGLEFLASLIMWTLPLIGSPTAAAS
jgi:hypothetical protein